MGPTPEPDPTPNLRDDRLPVPVVFLSDEEDSEDELPAENDYPPGYIPIQQHMDIQWISDSEEEPSEINNSGIEHSSSALQTESGDSEIDYSNLNALMMALNNHGPNEISGAWGLENAFNDEEIPSTSNSDSTNNIDEALNKLKLKTLEIHPNKECDIKTEFNSTPLSEEKEEAVLDAMKGFSLPLSSIPSWAADVKDRDLSVLVKERLNFKEKK